MNTFEIMQNLKEEEIDEYIKHRLSFLKNKEETVLGINTDNTIFRGLLDEKVTVNVSSSIRFDEDYLYIDLASLVFDDDNIYKYLINNIKKTDNPFDAVIKATDEYLSLDDEIRKDDKKAVKTRSYFYFLYSCGLKKDLSIKAFHKYHFAMCSEIAGLIHNMYKFLGIESDYVIGELDGITHAFNIVYFWGRDKEAIIIDGTREYGSCPGIFILDNDLKESIYSYNKIIVNEKDIIDSYDRTLGVKIHPEKQEHRYSIQDSIHFEVEDCKEVPSGSTRILKYKLPKENN